MSARTAPPPPWAQILLAVAALVALWIIGQTVGQALLIFIVSVILAMLLNPVVRVLRRLRVPRGLAVLAVFLGFIATVVVVVLVIIDPIRTQVEEIQRDLPVYTDQAERRINSLQRFFDERGIDVNVRERGNDLVTSIEERTSEIADNALSYSLDVLGALIVIVLIVVAAIYMLLDAPRILAFVQQIGGRDAAAFVRRAERSLAEYVKAQFLVATVAAVLAGVVLWIYGVTGLFPLGATFAVAFAAWVFLTEFIPYVGAFLGAIPPVLLALFTTSFGAVWVIIAFVAIQQLQGNIVAPKVMGSAVGVHPLVVIFGLVVGQQIAGVIGVLIAIPTVVLVKETVLFASQQLRLGARQAEPAPADDPAASAGGDTTARAPLAGATPPDLERER